MGLSIVTGPTTEPLTLAEAKAHCRIDISDDDGLLAGYILAARHWIEGQTHRAMVQRTYDYTIDWCWPTKNCRSWIDLPFPPLVSVTSVSYVDTNGATQTLSTSLYTVMTNRPVGAITNAYEQTWPDLRPQVEAITVRFVAGYASVPDDLVQAMKMLVAHWYENRETVVIGQATEVPMAVEALVSAYRVVSFG